MAWTTLTEDMVLSALNNAELTAAKTIALKSGQTGTSVVANLITWTTDMVRGMAKTQVEPPSTGVPPSLVLAALDIVIFRLLNRINPELAERRKTAYEDAMAMLKDVVDGKLEIDVGDSGLSGVPMINDESTYTTMEINDRTITHDTCDGM